MTTGLPLDILQSAADQYGADFVNRADTLARYPLGSIVSQVVFRDGLNQTMADEARIEFFQYMLLTSISDKNTAPPRLADLFWHRLILNTFVYAKFCNSIFGKFVHHSPANDFDNSQKSVDRTISLFKSLYGKDIKLSDSSIAPGIMASHGKECEDGGEDGY
jgi:hypothetical protein